MVWRHRRRQASCAIGNHRAVAACRRVAMPPDGQILLMASLFLGGLPTVYIEPAREWRAAHVFNVIAQTPATPNCHSPRSLRRA